MLNHDGAAAGPADHNLPVEFKFEAHVVRTVVRDGEPWFVAADVCDVLDIKNPSDALTRLDDDERALVSIEGIPGGQSVNLVNEFGLYSLILGSRKPEAKRFKRWVTHEVLPAIRKTGRYEAPPTSEPGAADDDAAQPEGPWSVTVLFPQPGRFSVMIKPDWSTHVYRQELDTILDENTALNCRILCHLVRLTETYWQKLQHLKSLNDDPDYITVQVEDRLSQASELARCLAADLDPPPQLRG